MTQQFGGGGLTSCSSASSVLYSFVSSLIIVPQRVVTPTGIFFTISWPVSCDVCVHSVSISSFYIRVIIPPSVGRCCSTAELVKDVSKVFSVVVTLHLFNLCYQKRVIVEVLLLYFWLSWSCFRGIIPEVSSFKNKRVKPRKSLNVSTQAAFQEFCQILIQIRHHMKT